MRSLDRFARSANAPTTPTVRPHCPHMYPPARTCASSSHTSSCPHTRHTCANYNTLHYCTYARPAGTYIYIHTVISYIIVIVRVGIHPVPSQPPPIRRVADRVFSARILLVVSVWKFHGDFATGGDRCGSLRDLLRGAAVPRT